VFYITAVHSKQNNSVRLIIVQSVDVNGSFRTTLGNFVFYRWQDWTSVLREQSNMVCWRLWCGVFLLDPLKLLKNVIYLAFSDFVACVRNIWRP